jgi:LPXTG-motif cell wall-anchored protein
MPLGFEDDVGVPLDARLTNEAGTEYTTTAGPTPFSDDFAEISGSFEMEVTDAQLMDGSSTEDEVTFTANFTGPDGRERTVRVLQVIPAGPDHPFLGGVGTNIVQHGGTGIGTKLMPEVSAYVAFWGVAELSVDGEVVASNRLVHGMLTNRTRDENYELVFNDRVDDSQIHFHLMMPNVEVTPDGPQESPVPTGFELPNGQEQPFFHIMYEDVSLSPGMVAPAAEPAEAPEAALPETGSTTTPWLIVGLAGAGIILLIGGLLIASRRELETVRTED